MFSKKNKKFELDYFMKHVIQSEFNDWENGNLDWDIDGKKFSQCVQEDSALIQVSNALKFLLLFKEVLGKKTLKDTAKVVKIYHGGIASRVGNWDDPNRLLISPLSHRIHVPDYLQYNGDTGFVSDPEYYVNNYMKSVINNPPKSMTNNNDELFVNIKDSKNDDTKVYNILNDESFPKARMAVRHLIEKQINDLCHKQHIKIPPIEKIFNPAKLGKNLEAFLDDSHPFLMHSLQALHNRLRKTKDKENKKELTKFNIMALAPYIALAHTLNETDLLKRVENIVAQSGTYYTSSNLFHDQFNIMGDPSATLFCMEKIKEYNKTLYMLPSQVIILYKYILL